MYLKEISLENFKSFGRKVKIPLQPGYTVITGPNGSGKSNISDGILFVLGPKSSKMIRAGKLTDLIYNGGKDKNPSTYATVSLTFDNSDRAIPYDADDVVLTRTVRKSTEGDGYASYFYVNGRKSSLGEFDVLLREAKLSADGYNFVQQGDVTRIVEMGNVERRRIIDDIAGITAFDEEIERAEKEKIQIETNLTTAKSVLSELKGELNKLEQEKKAAERYLSEKKRLENSRLTLDEKKLATTEEELKSINEQISGYSTQIEKLTAEVAQREEELKRLESSLKSKDDEIDRAGGEEAREIRNKLDDAKISRAKNTDGADGAREQADEFQLSLKALRSRQNSGVSEAKKLSESIAATETELAEKSRKLEESKTALSELESKLGEGDERSGKLQSQINKLNNEIAITDEDIRHLQLEHDRIKEKTERDSAEFAKVEDAKNNIEFEFKDAVWQLKDMGSGEKEKDAELRKCQDDFVRLKRKEGELSTRIDELEKNIKSLTREYERLKAQHDARADMQGGYMRGIRALLETRDRNEIKGIYGTVAELCRIEKDFEEAIQTAAGSRMNAIVVEDDGVAATCINFLKKSGLGRITFLPLNKMMDGRPRGKAIMSSSQTLGFAIDHIEFEDKFRPALWYVFGDTLVVRNLDDMRRLMGGIRLVTLDGDIAEASGAMIGGSADKGARKQLVETGRLDEVGEKLRSMTVESEQKGVDLMNTRSELRVLEEKIKHLKASAGDSSRTLSELTAKRNQLEKSLNEHLFNLSKFREANASSEKLLVEVDAKLETATLHSKNLKAERDAKSSELLSDKPKEVSNRVNTLREDISLLKDGIQESTIKASGDRVQLQFLEKSNRETSGEIVQLEQKISALREKAKECEKNSSRLQIEISALEKMEESVSSAQAALRKERDEIVRSSLTERGLVTKARERIDTLRDLIITQKRNMVAVEEKKRELSSEIETLRNGGAVRLEGDFTMDKLKDEMASAEKTLSSIGGVNMLAIEDYEQTSSRCENLQGEIGEFEEKKKSLIKLVDEINKKKRAGLMRVFDSINTNFRQIYSRLSGGSDGELVLENMEDPLQGGMIIKVRQKERKTLRIEALSGGEKSLAALAFIFSIQQFDPSPAYFMDEVDMFLDGINSESVARMVKGLSATAQFLQVSLRKVTLNSADRLIGVTKQLTGLSEVFLRELPDAEMAQSTEMQGVEG